MDVRAMTVPTNVVLVPSVAELPTFQKTLHACAPLMSATVLLDPVMRVLADWKMKTAVGSPLASRVTVPSTPSDSVVPVYTPPTSVRPSSTLAAAPGPREAASL